MKYLFKWKGGSFSVSVRATFVAREEGNHIVHVFPEKGHDFAFLATIREMDGCIVATSHLGVTTFQPE